MGELKKSEEAFPRGGGTALTPLELKEIHNEAARDVLFETQAAPLKKRPAKALPAKKKAKKAAAEADEDEAMAVEHLWPRNLVPGTPVLGQVAQITRLELALAIGDNLIGYVPITQISPQVTAAVEAYEQEGGEDDEDARLPELTKLFKVGQWVMARVTTNTITDKSAAKKTLEMTIEPEAVNQGIEPVDVAAPNVIQCSVALVEDHGYIMTPGIGALSAFIPHKQVAEPLAVGSVVMCEVLLATARAVTVRPARGVQAEKAEDKKEKKDKKDKKDSKDAKDTNAVVTISSVDAIHPGQVIDALVAEVSDQGLGLRAFGLVDALVSYAQMHCWTELAAQFGVGNPVKARILAVLTKNGQKKLVLSLLPQVLGLNNELGTDTALEAFSYGHKFDEVPVVAVDDDFLYVKLGAGYYGEVHRSQTDAKHVGVVGIEYRVGTAHPARVTGYNPVDGLFTLTMDPSKVECEYLTVNDVPTGAVVDAEIVEVDTNGGIRVQIAAFAGYVPPSQVLDVRLVYPERKYKKGQHVRARVLYKTGRTVYVTLKKLLLAMDERQIVESLADVEIGTTTMATVEKFVPKGALVSFFGSQWAFLPQLEISEAFVKLAKDHLRLGQTVEVTVVQKEGEGDDTRVVVSMLKLGAAVSDEALRELVPGHTHCDARVVQKTKDTVVVELVDLAVPAVLPNGHVADEAADRCQHLAKKLEINEVISVLVLEVDLKARTVVVTAKPLMVLGVVPALFDEVVASQQTPLAGYVKLVTSMGLFVLFAARVTGLIRAKDVTTGDDLDKRYKKNQLVLCQVLKLEPEDQRFLLVPADYTGPSLGLRNPVDPKKKLTADYKVGTRTKAVVKQVKASQLNVQLADNVRGRVDVSCCFESFGDIADKRTPLSSFEVGQVLDVQVVGLHDALKLLFELLLLDETPATTVEQFEPQQQVVGFVNNVVNGQVWVTLLPLVHGRVSLLDIVPEGLPLDALVTTGQALELAVSAVDADHHVVELKGDVPVKSFGDLEVGSEYPCRVIKTKDLFVLVELAGGVLALAHFTDALGDFDDDVNALYPANSFHHCRVLELDADNQRAAVSFRTSDDTKDTPIELYDELKRGDVVRGFIKTVGPQGVFVSLGRLVFALVPGLELFDEPVENWRKLVRAGQLVRGRITKAHGARRVLMTMKPLVVDGELELQLGYEDIAEGQVFAGTVRTVTEFGVFVQLDGTDRVLGLCHKLEMADTPVETPALLFGENDRVQVVVIKKNPAKKQLSLGMKALYFVESEGDDDDDAEAMDVDESDSESEAEHSISNVRPESSVPTSGLLTNGFDWTASILDQANDLDSELDDEDFTKKKKKAKKQTVRDHTADLDAPASVADFEKLILGNPNSLVVWMNYMSFQLQVGDVDKAREVGRRALKTINYREEQEKLNMWIALLNVENLFGTDDSLKEVFAEACQYQDAYVVHQKLVAIYTMLEKFDEARELYETMLRKFGRDQLPVWTNYGQFLVERGDADGAREVLARAIQVLPKKSQIDVVKRFATMEFTNGNYEQGRTLFEGLVQDAPKRIDLWNVYIDQEIKAQQKDKAEELFDRVLQKKVNKKQAKFFFAKWLRYEEDHDDEAMQEKVKAKAKAYVEGQNV